MKVTAFFIPVLLIAFCSATAQPNFNCRLLDAITKHEKAFANVKTDSIVLIDTVGFFTASCEGRYGTRYIKIVDKPVKRIQANTYGVNIGANEKGFAVGLLHQRSNEFSVFYFSILGSEIIIRKVSQGDF